MPDYNHRKYPDYESFVSAVVKEALSRTKYKAICTDDLYQFFREDRFYKAVEYAIDNTAYWEGDF